MNLVGIYECFDKREIDYVLKLWNHKYETHISLPLLPFLDTGIVCELIAENIHQIKEASTDYYWRESVYETVALQNRLLEKLRAHLNVHGRDIVIVDGKVLQIVLAEE